MKLDRKEILTALETISVAGEGKNMVESGAVKNVLIFGNEVNVDLLISTPAMHIKKRAEDDIRKLIHEKFSPDAVVKVNIKVETPTQNPNEISEAKQVTQKGNYTESKEEVLNSDELAARNREAGQQAQNRPQVTETITREMPKINRNDTVTIKHVMSGKSETMKFKKAEALLASGEYVLVSE